MTVVPSYLCDEWVTPDNPVDVREVRDASTGEVVATVSTEGLDLSGALDYARTTGQRSLQELTLHERALKLKKLATYLNEHKSELYSEANKAGATQRDNFIDVDGGISTLFTFSSKGRREMPNSNVVLDGPPEVFAKDFSFQGRHVYTPLTGVAVQINAFNFPVWGMLEKFAPAFIAGMPTIVKPATDTGYVTETCVRLMVESGILPAGSLQLISGSLGDLLDRLNYNDHVAFTGSAATAHTLRTRPSVQASGVRFTSEADSLNAAVLGPDATPGTPEFDAYVKMIFTEQTSKAGQKCTAIRRAIVPQDLVKDLAEALKARLEEKVVVGDPREENTTMGPLVSARQAVDVAEAVQKLVDAGGTLVTGGPDTVEGSFIQPTVLTFEDSYAERVHDTEAFGPVVSILGYTDIDDAVELVALGKGSLVASAVTHDPDTARTLAAGIAAHHGRLHFLDRDDAKTSTGHGSPLPHLIHGGPGRAGGGEELGGVRAVKHYMQRTAVQGTPNHLTAITGEWHRGADVQRVTRADVDERGAVHPFRKDLATLKVGDQFASDLREVTLKEILAFAEETGDIFYAHVDEEAATANPFFPRRVAHGYLLVSWAAGLFVEPAPGPVLANYGLENLRFIEPVTYGDSVRVELTAKRITPRMTDDYGEVAWDTVLYNQNDEIVAQYDVLTLVEKVNTTYANWNQKNE
ncbi:phenylacetic acid degradation bifunctional protein PaaZ [Corynebacterium urealyticum]|uniref:phenylacetic acid degradation bifunctional protein PaaZ n=1 Tax=Corynebacterium urealyticum TaxID=43771 RepID=UPI0002B3F459|nr:phenylacetic acid degradation bifunctional protein PaaZ [Corynebacterium urealyticum]AGE36169.1 Bifunctional protein PaaZ [Corynebacterium urealyticum DSM 7111]QQB07844.1 phenylacetic acid degradation bifunctional protein PaaZ [Corynebacterium urealyticum]TYR15667.1 phenylacetic acid degradation bifunctional protein PaaZ [Corynebacterium urealyticum]TYR18003.1 phenylacetic acid degradation bifunctional protein PaaZ [Corynebacterium urealyticum]